MEPVVICIFLAICCALLFWDRRRLHRRAQHSEEAAVTAASAVEKLQSERRFLDKIINSIGDPIFVKDPEHRYVYVNDAKCRLTGAKRNDIIGKNRL